MGLNISLYALDARGVRRMTDLWTEHTLAGRYGTIETDAHPYWSVAPVDDPVSLIAPRMFRNPRTNETVRTGFDPMPVAFAVAENWNDASAKRLEVLREAVCASGFPATLGIATGGVVVWRPLTWLRGCTVQDLIALAATPMVAPATVVVEKLTGTHFDAGYRSLFLICAAPFARLLWDEWGGTAAEWDRCDHEAYTWPAGAVKAFQAGRAQVCWEERDEGWRSETDKVTVMSVSGPSMQTEQHTSELYSNLIVAPEADATIYHRMRSDGCSIDDAAFAATQL